MGNVIDSKAVKINESAEHARKYGKLEVDLYEKLQKMQPDEKIKVALWLTPINITLQQKPYKRADEKARGEFLAAYKQDIAEKEKPVIDALEAVGFKALYTSQYAPLIYAEIPKNIIIELEKRNDIDAIYISRTYKPELNSAAYTEKADAVWNQGITGSGIKVAIVEDDGIEFANPNLTDGIYYNSTTKNIGAHATEVAGVVASTNPTYKGIAYGAPGLLSANSQDYSDASIIAATEWALNNGANIVSNSWGSDTGLQMGSMDRYLDHLVWTHQKTVVKSAGNFGLQHGNVTSPGLGYNMITVGAFDDMDDFSWSNDVMASYSSYRDPISLHNDREKPEVVAVGSRIITTSESSPWVDYAGNGTSYAAPSVSGEAALLMQTESWLASWPETVKAIIMASAAHNIEGNSALSEYDGAGGIDISRAYEIANNDNMSGDVLFASDFPKNYTFTVTSVNQKIRVAIAWDSHPDSNHPPTNDTLESDLDLYILDPNGNIVANSTSYDNSYEIVEFTPETTGTFKARVNAYRFDGAYEYLGFAKTLPYLSGWDHRKQKIINGSTAGAQTNYQMKLTVYKGSGTDTPGTVYLGGNARSDFGDIRFTKSDGVTLLDYWIESYTSGVNATVWVEIDSIPASPNNAGIYLYYGNPSAASASNASATFVFFDDFEDTDFSEWNIGSSATMTSSSDQHYTGAKSLKYSVNLGASPISYHSISQGQYEIVTYIYDPGYGGFSVPCQYMAFARDASPRLYAGIDCSYCSTEKNYYAYFDDNNNRATWGTRSQGWHKLQWIVNGSTTKMYIDDSLIYTSSQTYLDRIGFYIYYWSGNGVGYGYFDAVRVRKYASPEPVWGS